MKVNLNGLAFCLCTLLAGYCFGGILGLGIAATIVALIQIS